MVGLNILLIFICNLFRSSQKRTSRYIVHTNYVNKLSWLGTFMRAIVILVVTSNKNIELGRVRFYSDRIESKPFVNLISCPKPLITDAYCIISGGIKWHLSFLIQHHHTTFSLWCECIWQIYFINGKFQPKHMPHTHTLKRYIIL